MSETRIKMLEDRLRELIGHLELASVIPGAIGRAYAPPLDADFLERARAALKEPDDAPDLLSIAKRWAALDGGRWFQERHAREKAELLADTVAAIAKAEGRS